MSVDKTNDMKTKNAKKSKDKKEKNKLDTSSEKKSLEKNNEENSNKEKKKKIIPAYQKKDEPEKKKKVKPDKKTIKSRITIAIIIAFVVLIGLAIFGIVSLINYNKYKPYKKYEETMKTYGFDKMYNNESAKTGESITKSEAIKMILSVAFNTSDISGFAGEPEENYDNAIWVEYAKYRGIIGDADITKDNANDKATYIEVIRYLANAKVKILEKDLNSAINLKVKDINKYKTDEQTAIEDMIENEIITINTKKINGKKHIFKGQMNELISNFAVKYNTLTINDEKINISEDKEPSNKDQYPYTLASVDKSVYEIEDYVFSSDRYKNAKEVYSSKKEFYNQITNYITQYFDTILNIDYKTINEDDFIDNLRPVMLYGVEEEDVKNYVDYVKENKIEITGKATVNLPAVYFDGRNYRVRTTVEMDLSNCITNKNLFFGDDPEGETEYDLKNTKMILDVPMGESIDVDLNLSIFNGMLTSWIAGNVEFEL